MSMLLMYGDLDSDTVLVLEADDFRGDEALGIYGSNLDKWPEDLGAYKSFHGLFMWTGEIPEDMDDDKWVGQLRSLNDKEWKRVQENTSPVK